MAEIRFSGFWRRAALMQRILAQRERRRGTGRMAATAALWLALAGTAAVPALGQSWWPFGGNEEPRAPRAPVPSEPVYQDPATVPPAQGYGRGAGGSSPICLELEQRLVQEGQRGTDSRSRIPAVQTELRQTEQAYRSHKQQLDRNDCYEYFLFSKTLKRTRRCVDLANQADSARQRIEDLEVQLRQLQGSPGRSYQDEIIRELARNNCGASYQQQARRQSGGGVSNFWEDGESSGYGGGTRFGALPYATYRTVCVRLCDGYYFPVSFATLPNHFQRDEEVCQSKCAAPAQLFYHQNPGAGMEQAVAARTNEPYKGLKTAFRYRKEYIAGCSCKMAEYQPAPGEVVHSAGGGDGGGWTAEIPTGSTPPPADEQQPLPPANGGNGETLPWQTSP